MSCTALRSACAGLVATAVVAFAGCSTPAAGGAAGAAGGATAATSGGDASSEMGHNLAVLDELCWRLELNKGTDYTVLAKAREGPRAEASVYVTGATWAEAFDKTVRELQAEMAAKGIDSADARAKNGGRSFSEEQIRQLQAQYRKLDVEAFYVKAVKTSGWMITCMANIGQATNVTALGTGDTLLAAITDALTQLDAEIAKRQQTS
ncbi:MAG: hypothetical protein U0575_15600 [Phycisphaerales bacterium]